MNTFIGKYKSTKPCQKSINKSKSLWVLEAQMFHKTVLLNLQEAENTHIFSHFPMHKGSQSSFQLILWEINNPTAKTVKENIKLQWSQCGTRWWVEERLGVTKWEFRVQQGWHLESSDKMVPYSINDFGKIGSLFREKKVRSLSQSISQNKFPLCYRHKYKQKFPQISN